MADEVWQWQNGTATDDALSAVAVGYDGTVLLAGTSQGSWGGPIAAGGGTEMVATKLQLTGSGAVELWRWQRGWDTRDQGGRWARLTAAEMAADGSVFLVGGREVDYSAVDSVVLHLNASGSLMWEWQGDSIGSDDLTGMALVGDDSGDVFVVGSTYEEEERYWIFVAYRVSSAGSQVWRWQGTRTTSYQFVGTTSLDDGSAVVLVGEAVTADADGGLDHNVVAVKLDSDGNELWVWEDEPSSYALIRCNDVAVASDTSVVLACVANEDEEGEIGGGTDFGAVMLNSTNGEEIWRWRGGTFEDDLAQAVTVTDSGDVILAGTTYGYWTGNNLGRRDFAAVTLSGDDGSVLAGWQGGSAEDDVCNAIAWSFDDTVIFAGTTEGNWSATNAGGTDLAAVRTLAPFTGTPNAGPPYVPQAEEYEPASDRLLAPILWTIPVVVAICLFGCCVRAGYARLFKERSAARQREQRDIELPVVAEAHPARVVGAAAWSRERGRRGTGGATPAEEGDVPHSHAVALPPTHNPNESARAWTVVAAEVVT